jgi:hypothetical protein
MESVGVPDAEFKLELPDPKTGGCSILMVGSTRCGKTTALKHILDTYFKKHIGAIFSESARAPAYQDMKYANLPLSSCFMPELIQDSYHINREIKNHYNFLYVLDDCPLVRNDKQLTKLATIYRNSNISAICCVQDPTMLNTHTRGNFNFVMLFHQNTPSRTEIVVKNFLRGWLPTSMKLEEKMAWFQKTTEDHHFLLVDNLNGTLVRCKINVKK